MDKQDVINAHYLSISEKVNICNTMDRTGTTKLCAVCEEIIENMSIGNKSLIEDITSLKDELDEMRTTVGHLENNVEDTDVMLSQMKPDWKRVLKFADSVGSIQEHENTLKNMTADFSHSVTDIRQRMDQIKEALCSLLEYIDKRKTINLRKETNSPKKLVKELDSIRTKISNDVITIENVEKSSL